MGVRKMPALGERGSLTCARCLLWGATGALPETPMAAGTALLRCPAPPAAAIQISRASGSAVPLALCAEEGPDSRRPAPPRPSCPAGAARRLRSLRPATSRLARRRPAVNLRGAPRPYWPRSPAPPPQPHPRRQKDGCDWANRPGGAARPLPQPRP